MKRERRTEKTRDDWGQMGDKGVQPCYFLFFSFFTSILHIDVSIILDRVCGLMYMTDVDLSTRASFIFSGILKH